jgi:AsmA family
MKLRKRTMWRLAGAAVALVLAAGLVAPLLDADRFGERVKASLRDALGREIEIGNVHLNLFSGPGFSVDRVVIHEDPAAGIEPFAYVESLDARVSFKSLWTGRLEFSSLKLEGASVNLARPEHGRWNIEYLLERTAGAAAKARTRLPEIQVRGGRINFKFGDTKSTFYLADSLVNVIPPSSPGGAWRARFEGEPARTDRGSQGFGRFTASGRWWPNRDTGGRIEVSIELEKSSLSDMIRLAHGHDLGVHGQISSQATLSGPLSDIQIAGHAQLRDIHRWDLMPPHGEGWPLDYRGKLDAISQVLTFETVPPAGGTLPVSLQLRVSAYLSQPRWSAQLTFDHFPLAPLPEVARHMGQQLPDTLALAGELNGTIGYSPETGVQGTLASGETAVTIPGAPPIRLASAQVRFDGESMHLLRTDFEAGKQVASVEGGYAWHTQALDAAIVATGMRIGGEQPNAPRLFGSVPVIGQLTKGSWRGQIEYRKQGDLPGVWTGTLQIAGAAVEVPGLAGPIELTSARAALHDDGVVVDRIQGRAGAIQFKGEYRYAAGAARPDQIVLSVPGADAQDLERLLMPALRRGDTLFERALRFGRTSTPEWLESRHADIALDIGTLTLGDMPLQKVHAHARWEGTAIEASDVAAQLGAVSLAGRLSVSLRGRLPAYRAAARFRGVRWMGGKWDGKGNLQTAGAGADLLANLRLEGSFKGHSIALAADTAAETVSGDYAFTVQRGVPLFRFSDLIMTVGDASFKGQGATAPDGRLYFDFSDGQKQMRLTATLSPLHLTLLP